VKPTERLATAAAPDGTELVLYRHDGAYQIRVDGVELMSTRRFHSEERLAELACEHLAGTAAPRVLVGGLGFGFTLKAVLRAVGADARVVVAELVPAVLEWNRNAEYALAREALADPRVEVRVGDVASSIAQGAGLYDAIILDVDNGADALTTRANRKLYGDAGVRAAVQALTPGGSLAYWSAEKDPVFVKTLERAGLKVETHSVRVHATSGGYCSLFIARRIRDVRTPAA
jgi:spermidine synthase